MTRETLPKQAERLARSHPRSLPAVGEQTWAQLRRLEARERRNRNWRLALIVTVLAVVYALAAHYYMHAGR